VSKWLDSDQRRRAASAVKYETLKLRPTQLALGHIEVRNKTEKMSSFSKNEINDYLHENPVPIVIAAKDTPFLIDHHHLVRACWEAGVENVVTEVKADLSHLKAPEFWEVMRKSHWVHLYDQFGKGPYEPGLLPDDIRCMADDPYRSLAWAVRREGGFQKCDVPFSEFHWADFFRTHELIEKNRGAHLEHDQKTWFEEAISKALKLCKTDACKKLPGFLGAKS
jgi:hypothetical protein